MVPLPSVFISHGSPMHALEAGPAGLAWAALGKRLGKPKAILIASAHWETNVPMVTGADRPQTIHDFSGFPEPLYRLRYTAPGAPAVAQRAAGLLKEQGLTAAIDGTRGLDHGAWAPLLYMYPDADVPVVQISLQPELGTRHHLRLGRALRALEEENVLVIGSGHMTHNLRDWMRGRGEPQPYAQEFSDWVHGRLEQRDNEALADYRSLAPHGARAHPTDEHFLPLFFALGASRADYKAERFYSAIDSGVLSMDGYLFN
ncbi:MAG TPA: class III extradiol ring-cleavage dioxygenase [Burkholderiales bacterium]|nr:class III extradiol ring-cleavage dioxygenase [Burkholderiales bacterium]